MIRRATPDDAAAISRLNAIVQRLHAAAEPTVFKEPTSDDFAVEQLREWLAAATTYFFLACEGDEPVGYIMAQVVERPENPYTYPFRRLHIDQIAVDERFRGRGYGAQLMQRVRELGQGLGITTLTLDTWAFNSNAQQFFISQGFTPFMHRFWLSTPS